jgi:hypothetical protein
MNAMNMDMTLLTDFFIIFPPARFADAMYGAPTLMGNLVFLRSLKIKLPLKPLHLEFQHPALPADAGQSLCAPLCAHRR